MAETKVIEPLVWMPDRRGILFPLSFLRELNKHGMEPGFLTGTLKGIEEHSSECHGKN